MRLISLIFLSCFAVYAHAAAVNYAEPLPGPSWGVYIPADANDNAGITDATKKCHWYEKSDNTPAVVGGSWFTHIVFFNGTLITNNNDPAIWNGASATIHLRPKVDNPAELEIVRNGAVLTEADGYAIMRMVYVRPGSGVMPATVDIGSPKYEAHRHKNEKKDTVTLAGNYWIAADECNQEMWKALVTDSIGSKAAGSLNADINAYLTDDEHAVNNVDFTGFGQPLMYATYADALQFCTNLTGAIGTTARLPNEAEWEYACRGSRDTAFNTETGYSLGGPEWMVGTNTTPPTPVDDADLDSYFQKRNDDVNGRTNGTAPPYTLTNKNVFVAGNWQSEIYTVEFIMSGGNPLNDPSDPAIIATQPFKGIAQVEANFDSRYKLWYKPVMYIANVTHSDGVSGYFTVMPTTINNVTPTILQEADQHNRDVGPAHEFASDADHLAHLVKGLYVGVDANGVYSHDPDAIDTFRRITDGTMPDGVTEPGGGIVYHKLVEFDQRGIYIQSPLPDEQKFFQDADQQLADTIANLPLRANPGDPNSPRTTFRQDADEQLAACVERAKSNANYAYVNWNLSKFTYKIEIDYAANLVDKQGTYALRNRLGIANMHGNIAEWCIPGNSTNALTRWDGVGTYDQSTAFAATKPYVAVRGGSWQSPAEKCRSAFRLPVKPDARRPTIGFRFIVPE